MRFGFLNCSASRHVFLLHIVPYAYAADENYKTIRTEDGKVSFYTSIGIKRVFSNFWHCCWFHQPVMDIPLSKAYVETWKAMESFVHEGKTKLLGQFPGSSTPPIYVWDSTRRTDTTNRGLELLVSEIEEASRVSDDFPGGKPSWITPLFAPKRSCQFLPWSWHTHHSTLPLGRQPDSRGKRTNWTKSTRGPPGKHPPFSQSWRKRKRKKIAKRLNRL